MITPGGKRKRKKKGEGALPRHSRVLLLRKGLFLAITAGRKKKEKRKGERKKEKD